MSGIFISQLGTIMIIRVVGELTFDGVIESLKGLYPHVVSHVLWDFTGCTLIQISAGKSQELLSCAKEFLIDRPGGKTAFVSPDKDISELLKMFVTLAETSTMPYEYRVFKEYEKAIEWLNEGSE